MSPARRLRDVVRRRWDEARHAIRSADFEALASLGTEPNRRLLLDVSGASFVVGGIAVLSVLLPFTGRLGMESDVVWLIGGAAVGLGVVQQFLPSGTPMWVLDLIVTAGGLLVVLLVAQPDGERMAGYGLILFVGPVVLLAVLRSSRSTLVQYAFIGTGFVVVFAVDSTFSDATRVFWGIVVLFNLVGTWQTTGWLARRARARAVRAREHRARAERAGAALEAISEERRRFLASVSHELRTPLNAAIGFSAMLQRGSAGSLGDRQGEYVDDIVESGRHLLALVDDTLDDAQIDSGEQELTLTEVSTAKMIDDAVRLVTPRAAEERLEIEVESGDTDHVVLDERKIRQVLVNLLSNAVKFTPAGGRVRVSARPVGTATRFEVADTGPGIDPSQHQAVFEAFLQDENSEPGGEGTGLGLAVARGLVELHGGRMWLESEPGAGARFFFDIPHELGEADRGAAAAAETERPRPHAGASTALSVTDVVQRHALLMAYAGFGCALGPFLIDVPEVSAAHLFAAAAYAAVVVPALVVAPRFLDSRQVAVAAVSLALATSAFATPLIAAGLGPLAATAAVAWFAGAFVTAFYELKLVKGLLLLHIAVVGVAHGVLLAMQSGNVAPVPQWLAVMGPLIAVSYLVRWLMRSLTGLARVEHEAAREADEAAMALDALTRHRARFLAGMSHELRTPLNAVIGFGESLQRGVAGPLNDQQREYVDAIVESGRHLLTVINNVLDLAKLDAGRLELRPRTLDAAAVIEAAFSGVRGTAEDEGIGLLVDVAPGTQVVADEARLAQAVAALLSNAVRFTPAGGRVAVAVEESGDVTRIAVSDDGPGLDVADHELVFEPFHHGSADTGRSGAGSGLGLALARRLIELHGGTLAVDSAPGAGATFTIGLPVRLPVPGGPLDDASLVAEAT